MNSLNSGRDFEAEKNVEARVEISIVYRFTFLGQRQLLLENTHTQQVLRAGVSVITD